MRRNLLFHISLLFVIPYMLLPMSHGYIRSPVIHIIHLTVLTGTLLIWLLARTSGRWAWYPSAADGAVLLWSGAIVISSLANLDDFRRTQPILWFTGALLVGWYLLNDALANGQISRGRIIDLAIVISTFMLLVSIYQMTDVLSPKNGLFGLPRLSGITGNPNLMSALLVPVFALSMGRFFTARGIWRMLMGIFILLFGVGIILTYSRGAWLATGAGLLTMALLMGIERGWHTRAARQQAWAAAKAWQRGLVVCTLVGAIVGSAGVGLFIYRSFGSAGRGADARTLLWESGLEGFAQSPLVGNGVFSTAQFILKNTSSPPYVSQPHAHNLPIQVLSDLGLLGAAVLLISVYITIQWGRRAWRSAANDPHQRYLINGGIASVIAVGVHCQFDLAIWTPYIALASLIGLLVMTVPVHPAPYAPARGRTVALACGLLALILVGTGFYSYTQNARYHALMNEALTAEGRPDAISGMADLIAQDPRQPVYYWTRGMMQGVEAYEKADVAQAEAALDSFNQALALGMESSVLHLNLAALYAQVGDTVNADAHLMAAADLAWESGTLLVNAALAAERWGMPDTARALWERIIQSGPRAVGELVMLPMVSASPIAAEFTMPESTPERDALALLLAGEPAAMLDFQDAHPEWMNSTRYLLRAVALHLLGRDSEVQAQIDEAYRVQISFGHSSRIAYFEMRIAGNDIIERPILDQSDEQTLRVVAYLHFMKNTFPRLILPQVEYDRREPFVALLDEILSR